MCVPGDHEIGTVGKAIDCSQFELAADGEIIARISSTDGSLSEPVKTGDIGKINTRGNLVITDRKNEIIVTSGGKNIPVNFIENALKESEAIDEAVVIGDGKPYVTALIFSGSPKRDNTAEISLEIENHIRKINKKLSKPEQIRKYTIIPQSLSVEAETLTNTQKPIRSKIKELYAEAVEDLYRIDVKDALPIVIPSP